MTWAFFKKKQNKKQKEMIQGVFLSFNH